jgi:uncharacterized membrane protein YciS (DUF1049 family)
MTAWLFLALVIAVLVVMVLLGRQDRKPETERIPYEVIVGLYAIRRRLDVARVKTEIRRDAAHLRRGLRDELRTFDERERL